MAGEFDDAMLFWVGEVNAVLGVALKQKYYSSYLKGIGNCTSTIYDGCVSKINIYKTVENHLLHAALENLFKLHLNALSSYHFFFHSRCPFSSR